MPWNKSEELNLLQVQIPAELMEKLDFLAEHEHRSKAKTAIFLLEKGIERLEYEKAVINEADRKEQA